MKYLKSLLLIGLLIGSTLSDNAFIVNWNSNSVSKTLNAEVGDTISFYSCDGKSHTVVSSDKATSSSTFSGSATNPGKFIVTLKNEGTVEFTSPNDPGLSLIATVAANSQTVITPTTTGSGTPESPTSTTSGGTSGTGLEGGDGSSTSTGGGSNGSTTSSSNTSSSSSSTPSDSSLGGSGSSTTDGSNDNIVETPTPTVTPTSTPTATPSVTQVPTSTPSSTPTPTTSPGNGSSGISCLMAMSQNQFDEWSYSGVNYKVIQVNFTNEGILPVNSITLTPSSVDNIFFVWEFKYDGSIITLPTYRDVGTIAPGSSITFGYISQNGDVTFDVKTTCESSSSSGEQPTTTPTSTPSSTPTSTPTTNPSGSSSEEPTTTPTSTPSTTPTETPTSTPTTTPTSTPTTTPTSTPTTTPTSTPTTTPDGSTANSCYAQVKQEVVNSWINGEVDHYIQVQATITNMGQNPITDFKFYSEAEQIWSVDKVGTNTYSLPSWASTIPVGSSHTFGYIVKSSELSTLEQVNYSCK